MKFLTKIVTRLYDNSVLHKYAGLVKGFESVKKTDDTKAVGDQQDNKELNEDQLREQNLQKLKQGIDKTSQAKPQSNANDIDRSEIDAFKFVKAKTVGAEVGAIGAKEFTAFDSNRSKNNTPDSQKFQNKWMIKASTAVECILETIGSELYAGCLNSVVKL